MIQSLVFLTDLAEGNLLSSTVATYSLCLKFLQHSFSVLGATLVTGFEIAFGTLWAWCFFECRATFAYHFERYFFWSDLYGVVKPHAQKPISGVL